MNSLYLSVTLQSLIDQSTFRSWPVKQMFVDYYYYWFFNRLKYIHTGMESFWFWWCWAFVRNFNWVPKGKKVTTTTKWVVLDLTQMIKFHRDAHKVWLNLGVVLTQHTDRQRERSLHCDAAAGLQIPNFTSQFPKSSWWMTYRKQ
jgi:hypothetical protein